MKATFKTKSNYKNCNGIKLSVVEANLDSISCEVPMYGFDLKGEAHGSMVTASFHIKELTGLFINIKN